MQNATQDMEFARITPWADEAAVGILGRLVRANACTSRHHTVAGLKKVLGLPTSASPWLALAAALDMQQDEFAYRHSPLPLLKAISANLGIDKESHPKSIGRSLQTQCLLRVSHHARYCIACMADDCKSTQGSFWHRTHLLPNIDWCTVHRTPLVVVAPEAFEFSPQDIVISSLEHLPTANEAEIRNPILQRYGDLLVRWLHSPTSFSTAALVEVLQQGCKKKGLRTSQHGNRPVISDFALEMLPKTWMARHMPELLTKEPGKFLQRLDGSAKDRHVAYPAGASALCLALLFESVDEIKALLTDANDRFLAKESAKTSILAEVIEAAKQAFADGASITTICRSHDLTLEQLEPSLREAVRALSRSTACAA